ncbi:MAG: chemotaxis protein CheW [Bacteriovoracaceae bacterium]
MSKVIFNEQWLNLSVAEKTAYVKKECFDLSPQIVFVDDDPLAIEILTNEVRKYGISLKGFTKIPEALIFLQSEKSSVLLIISDFRMPEGNGFLFREKVNEICPEIPFVILSGYVDKEMALKGMELKVSAFFEKPMQSDIFLNLLYNDGEKRIQSIREDMEMLRSFTTDASNILEEVESLCLELEQTPNNAEAVNRIFGMIHTIKGSSGFFEPKDLHRYAHSFEDLMKEVQAGSRPVTAKMISVWLKAVDVLKVFNNEFITGTHNTYDVDKLKEIFVFTDDEKESEEKVTSIEVEKSSDHGANKDKVAEIKVSMDLLDEFMQMSGEMTVIRNMINKSVRSIEKQYQGDKDVAMLAELLEEMHKINSDVQTKITDIRKVSASSVVKPLSRTVRDTCRALSKDIILDIEGQDLRLDNSVAEILSKSLIHMVRNSIDHGIESAEKRVMAKKEVKGKLSLRFLMKGDLFQVEIEDDGAGINEDKIKEKMIEKGIRTKAQIELMHPEEIWAMIFDAGFSTAKEVTAFSGRGVGMSMVKDCVEEVGGKIMIESVRGKGSKFTLEIPAPKSVLITNCLFFQSCNMTFGVPQNYIIKVLDDHQLNNLSIQSLEGAEVIEIEGRLLPIFSNAKILGQAPSGTEKILIVMKEKNYSYVLKVEELLDIEDTVIKPLPFNFLKNIGLYLGGTFLSDATIGLIYDIPAMIKKMSLKPQKNHAKQVEDYSNLLPEKALIEFSIDKLQGNYCLAEEDVERIEQIPTANLERSAKYHVLPYRESLLTLVHVGQWLQGGKLPYLFEKEILTILICRHKDQYLGLVIDSVSDLVKTSCDLNALLKKQKGLEGSYLIDGSVVTKVNFSEIVQSFDQKEFENHERPGEQMKNAA